jgi:hypothetical protein
LQRVANKLLKTFARGCLIKGTVWRDVREVENRLKQSVLENYLTSRLYFSI